MGFKEAFSKFLERKKEEKDMLKDMERELRLKKRLEQKMKTPAQKEYEFYQREEQQNNLDKFLRQKRKEREKKLKKLSSPLNNKPLFKGRLDLIGGDFAKPMKKGKKINIVKQTHKIGGNIHAFK